MKRVLNILVFILLISYSSPVNGYDPATHREIAQRATGATISSLDQVLKGELGLSGGIRETVLGISEPGLRSVQQLVGDGAFFEDVPSTRSLNHFHNPLQPWESAGLRTFSILGVPLIRGQSSVLWQQNPSQDTTFVFTPLPFLSGGGNWSWQDARRHYVNVLTRTRKEDITREDGQKEPGRDTALAETFEALGRLTHLIQDASVPAHVRNDPHPEFSIFGVDVPLISNPDGYERHISRVRGAPTGSPRRNFFEGLLNQPPKRPPFSIFTPGNTQAPVPIARLLDTDLFGGLNSEVLTATNIGIAEYTNGNFLSDDTIVSDFALPRRTGLIDFFESEDGKLQRYFEKAFEGESIRHFVAESALYEPANAELGGPMDEALTLTRRVYEDYAEKLLPRAVGYSAGLLDYFFRGKLDVDLVPDPQSTDPTVVKLSGTNGSSDKLDGGALALYADDPLTGERSLVSALEPNFTVTADPGQPVESAKFQINAEAERFMAVYKGKLGNEVPQGDFPGGVIGKVLGGVRAESIYADGDKRMLRTVDGVFALPLTTDGLQSIQWGDQDNTFVGIKSFTPGLPDQIMAFKINRPLGSPEAPLMEGTQIVSVESLKAADFPFDLALKVDGVDVTVNYSQSFHLKQTELSFDVFDTKVFDESQQIYNVTSRQVTPPTARTVLDQTIPFSQSFRIVLDRAHLCFSSCFSFGDFIFFIGPVIRPYVWRVREVGLDNQGRLLALVLVTLIEPENNTRTVELAEANLFGSTTRTIFAGFQVSDLLWALIDVEKGIVLGVTSLPEVLLASEQAITETSIRENRETTHIGGTLDGTTITGSAIRLFRVGNPDFTTVEAGSISLPTQGLFSLKLEGLFRDDLGPLVNASAPFEFSTLLDSSALVYFVDDLTKINKAIGTTDSFSFRTGTLTSPPDAQVIRPTTGTSSELLLFFRQQESGSFSTKGLLVRWSPQFPSNTATVLPEKLPPADFYSLLFTTSEAALLEGEDSESGESFALLVDFTNKTSQTLPGPLGFDYVLLDPKFLYNINDTKFHTLDSSLRPTALPRPLAAAPQVFFPPPTYHLIQLR